LEQRRQGWYVVLDVPKAVQEAVGQRRKVQSLKTRDLSVAQLRRWPVIAEWQREFARGKRAPAVDTLIAEALEARDWLDRAEAGERVAVFDPAAYADPWGNNPDPAMAQKAFLLDQIGERARAIAETKAAELGEVASDRAAMNFLAIATGKATPLDGHVEAWIGEGGKNGPLVPTIEKAYRRALAELSGWCAKGGRAAIIESVDRKIAGAFVAYLLTTKRTRSTINNVVFALSAYWSWLKKRGHIGENPWTDQTVRQGGDRGEVEKERPFTDAELAKLLAADTDQVLLDAMRLAALSGLRIAEMHELRVSDIEGDGMFVRKGKNKNSAARWVPIHPDLPPILARLTKGKGSEDFLLPGPTKGTRYEGLSDRFRRLQVREEVYDRSGGQRRSTVNWHSFRRWFVSRAERAGIPETTVALVVGHARSNVTFGRYSRDHAALWANKVACVQAVQLPSLRSGAVSKAA
jgi:integrase